MLISLKSASNDIDRVKADKRKCYHNVFFTDLPLLGTSTELCLFLYARNRNHSQTEALSNQEAIEVTLIPYYQ